MGTWLLLAQNLGEPCDCSKSPYDMFYSVSLVFSYDLSLLHGVSVPMWCPDNIRLYVLLCEDACSGRVLLTHSATEFVHI